MPSPDDFNVPIEPVARAVLEEFMGAPNKALSSRTELRWGSHGSVSVDLTKNVWSDHEEQTGGGVLDLLKAFKGYEKPEALQWLQEQGLIEKRERPANGAANGQHAPQGKFAGFMDHHPIATYAYHDAKGALAYEVLKFAKDAPRRFMQRRPHPSGKGWIWGLQEGLYGRVKSGDWFKAKSGKTYEAEEQFPDAVRWLYRRVDVLAAIENGDPVFLCEGEKDAETLHGWGFCGTTNAGGAKYWSDQFDEDLTGADIVILPDNDDAGRQRAQVRGAALMGKAKSVRVLDLADHWANIPEKADVTDWKEKASGTAEKFAELVDMARTWKPERPKSLYGGFTWDQVGKGGKTRRFDYVIDGWLPERGRSVVAGPSQSGKSFLAIHMAMCIARGVDFFGNQADKGLVIYQAGEGGYGIENRFDAYRRHNEIGDDADIPIVVLPEQVDLYARDGDTEKLIAEIRAWQLVHSHPLRLIVIDTLATATVGADENSGKDMGYVLENIARIERELRCHVMLVHHMNAAGHKLRGHTSVHANVDTVVTTINDEATKIRTVKLAKQKDGEDGKTIRFKLRSIDLEWNEKRKRHDTSCVVVPVKEAEALEKEGEKLGFSARPSEEKILIPLFKAIDRYGKFVATAKDGPEEAIGKSVVKLEYFLDVAVEMDAGGDEEGDARGRIRKHFDRNNSFLLKAGVIGFQRPYVWWTGKPVRGFPHTFPNWTNPGHSPDISGTNPGQAENPAITEYLATDEVLL